MQQRVALSRVLVADPDIILMDEPFGALDEFTREKLNLELLRIWDESRKTVLFVTHNINEAVFLSDRVVVMGTQPGRVISVIDVPFRRPRSVEVMREPVYTDKVFEIRRLLGLEER
jgi:NitT/TauT family transport system ATP-binding protein